MKKIALYFLTLLSFLALASCKEYLDIKPYGRTIPKTTEEFAALLHNNLNTLDLGESNYILGNAYLTNEWDGACGDDFETSLTLPAGRSLKTYVGDIVGSTKAYSPYADNYTLIRDCNIVLDGIKDKHTKADKELKATAYALRAVAYYQLMRLYCDTPDVNQLDKQLGMPLVTEFDLEARPQRSSLKELISLIESDLKRAISLKNTNELYRFTEDVCKAYLARLYFWSKDWAKALPLAQEIVSKYPLVEGDAYKAMFDHKQGALKGNQLIKAYRIVTSEFALNNANASIKGRPVSLRYTKLYTDEEKTKDIRYTTWLDKNLIIQKGYFCGVRSAEFKLVEAECLYHLGREGEALQALNDLRAKRIQDYKAQTIAELKPIANGELITVDAMGKPLTELISAILKERRKELILECDRFFELKRNGKPQFSALYKEQVFTTLPYMYTYPLPPSDVKISDLKQNAGYTDFITE